MARLPIARYPKSFAALGLLVVVGLVVIWTQYRKPATTQGGRGSREAVAVRVTKVQRIAVQRQVELSGTLLAIDQAKVSSEAAGVIRDVPIQIGSIVAAGGPLVVLDKREYALSLDRAESALRQTRAQLGMTGPLGESDNPPPDDEVASARNAYATFVDAKASADRAKVLAGRGLLAPSELQATDTKLKVAEAAYQSASDTVRGQKALLQDRRASYNLALKKVNDTVVRAPFSGIVADRPVQAGEFIGERTIVATIVRVNPLKVRTGAQEKHAGTIRPGQEVQFRVESYGDTVFGGKVAYVSPSLDQTMRTFTVEALVDNADQRLKPGFFAKGVILTKKDEGVLAVPETAVSTLAGVSSVYVVQDGRITQQQITLGVRQGNLWEVVDGLKGDETLANNRLNELATGTSVQIGTGEAGGGQRGGGGRRGQGGGRRGGQRGQGGQPGGES
ncbi:MAG: efflux RND transporter periplasmic adaptor subunit [Acidobacteria bacterium]|nr:efflux RND transporter periplasmic adaptor subunit [Acidobacteriota bacterium]